MGRSRRKSCVLLAANVKGVAQAMNEAIRKQCLELSVGLCVETLGTVPDPI